jgi:hypothetical protein
MRTRIYNIATLTFFALITFSAIKHSGEANDVCKSEWKAPVDAGVTQEKSGKNESGRLDRISKLDLVLPGVILGL